MLVSISSELAVFREMRNCIFETSCDTLLIRAIFIFPQAIFSEMHLRLAVLQYFPKLKDRFHLFKKCMKHASVCAKRVKLLFLDTERRDNNVLGSGP